MSDPWPVLPGAPKRVGIAADHGGFELKKYLAGAASDEACKPARNPVPFE